MQAFTELILCSSKFLQTRQTLRVDAASVLHLLFYILQKEKAKEDVLGEGLPIYDGIDLPVSLFRRNNEGVI